MCGKFTQLYSWQDPDNPLSSVGMAPDDKIVTVTPMRFASVLRLNAGVREMAQMRWGFSKIDATAPGAKPDHIHARGETIDVLPTFRDSFRDRRGLLVVKSFNEAREITPTKFEQQVITPDDGKPMGIAVVWEGWEHQNGETLLTFVMVTTAPNALIATVTDRMPAIIAREDWGKWLGEEKLSLAEIKALLHPFEGHWSMRPEKPSKASPQGDLF